MKNLLLVAALLGSALMGQSQPLADGVYAVEEVRAKAKNLAVRTFEGKEVFLDGANFAPLVIEGKPEIHRGPQDSWLGVQLAREAAKKLEDLTRSHLNRRVAVVVDDRVVSAPVVRSVIQDGKARVTPCSGDACEKLLRRLDR